MKFNENTTYLATITFAGLISSQKGMPGIQIGMEESSSGENVTHVLWISPKTIQYLVPKLAEFGITEDNLRSQSFLDNIGSALVGKGCSFTWGAEEYHGKTTEKVVNFGGPKEIIPPDELPGKIAEMFGGTPRPRQAPKPQQQDVRRYDPQTDAVDDLPF